jgi:hypothetical protein
MRPIITTSATLAGKRQSTWLRWGTYAMQMCPRGPAPEIFTSPEVGGITPATTLNRVLFPAPLGPTTATRSPV